MPKPQTIAQLDAEFGQEWTEDYENWIKQWDYDGVLEMIAQYNGEEFTEKQIHAVLKRRGIDRTVSDEIWKQRRIVEAADAEAKAVRDAEQNAKDDRNVGRLVAAILVGIVSVVVIVVWLLFSQDNGSPKKNVCEGLGARQSLNGDNCIFS